MPAPNVVCGSCGEIFSEHKIDADGISHCPVIHGLDEKAVREFLRVAARKLLDASEGPLPHNFPVEPYLAITPGISENGDRGWAVAVLLTSRPELATKFFQDFSTYVEQVMKVGRTHNDVVSRRIVPVPERQ